MNKIKRWFVHKLGGLLINDLPFDIVQQLLNQWANNAVDKELSDRLKNGFKTRYTS